MKTRIAVLVSGGGTNLQALIDFAAAGKLKSGELSLVVSSDAAAFAISRAAAADIPVVTVARADCADSTEFEKKLLLNLAEAKIDMIVLAGFMCILSDDFVKKYSGRIINVHPSLIPSFCGRGMYGLHVHEAALAYGVKVTGATVHYVNEIPDGGEIILQKAVQVRVSDTPKSLQKRVMKQAEWEILPRAAELVAKKILKQRITE